MAGWMASWFAGWVNWMACWASWLADLSVRLGASWLVHWLADIVSLHFHFYNHILMINLSYVYVIVI